MVRSSPRAIFCSSAKCFEAFGFHVPAKAKTIGVSGIVIGSSAWNKYFLRHEIIHHLQSGRFGVVGHWLSPMWFNGGMAYSLSGDPRALKEPLASYCDRFDSWHRGVGKMQLWNKAKKLRVRIASRSSRSSLCSSPGRLALCALLHRVSPLLPKQCSMLATAYLDIRLRKII